MASSVADELPFSASSVVFMRDRDKRDDCIRILREKLGPVVAKWKRLGIQLDLSPDTLDKMKATPGEAMVADKFEGMLRYWLDQGEEKTRTWGFLVKAVEKLPNMALAEEITQRRDFDSNSKVCLGLKELTTLLEQEQASWRKLARNLHIPDRKVDEIAGRLLADDCLHEVVQYWIKNSKYPTLEELIKALESTAVENRALAKEIARDVEVLKLLRVANFDKDKAKTEKELKEYIEILEEEQKKLEEEIDGLPSPPTHLPEESDDSLSPRGPPEEPSGGSPPSYIG